MKPINLSVVILAKNAQNLLVDALESVSFADEVIVVDTHSTDLTVEIAKSKGAKIIKGEENNFAENRNKGLQVARGEWVLYIDTDERVSPSLKEHIQQAIASDNFTAYRVQRKNARKNTTIGMIRKK